MGREYTSEQELEEISRLRLKDALSMWIVNDQEKDYGFDFEVRITTKSEDGKREATGTSFYVQLKASKNFDGGKSAKYDIDVDYLKIQCLESSVPVVLVLYEETTDELYWEILQPHCWDTIREENPEWREQNWIRIKVPRTPLQDSIEDFQKEITTTDRRIALKQSVELDTTEGLPAEAGPSQIEEIRNDLLEQYMRKSVALGQQYLEEEQERNALRCFARVFEQPHQNESKLKAGIELLKRGTLNNDNLNDVAAKGHILSRAMKLADEYAYEEILEEMREESQIIKPYICSELVGSRFRKVSIDECFTVVSVEDWIPDENGLMMVALQQYDDGTPYDQNAIAIIEGEDYEPLDDTGPALQDCCPEGMHRFDKQKLYRESGPAFCKECGLSAAVIMEFVGQGIPFVCEECDEIKKSSEFTEGYICKHCA